MKQITLLLCLALITACSSNPTLYSNNEKPIPERAGKSSANQIIKTDFDRMANVELEENLLSLKTLMLKLYKRNPKQLIQSSTSSAQQWVNYVFDEEAQHHWKFKQIQDKQGLDALYLTFQEDYQGDRVLPFIVGLATMYLQVHGDKDANIFSKSINPQSLYNAARNVEIAAWKLSSSRNAQGELFLLTNEINLQQQNLSFEREFGKMIGRTDLYAYLLEEKSQRLISRVVQSLATAPFLPF
jgi:hypothetical protein